MKKHLYVGPGGSLTVCGKQLKHFGTWDIDEVTCAMCIAINYNRGQKYAREGREYLEDQKRMSIIVNNFESRSLDGIRLTENEISWLDWAQRTIGRSFTHTTARQLILDRRRGEGAQRSLRERYAQPVTYSPRGRGPVVAGTSLATGVWVTYTEPKVKAWEQPIYDDIHIHDSRDSAKAIFSMGKGALIAYWPFGMSMDDAILAWNARFDADYSDCLRD